jgi:hypothetical protein
MASSAPDFSMVVVGAMLNVEDLDRESRAGGQATKGRQKLPTRCMTATMD